MLGLKSGRPCCLGPSFFTRGGHPLSQTGREAVLASSSCPQETGVSLSPCIAFATVRSSLLTQQMEEFSLPGRSPPQQAPEKGSVGWVLSQV